MKKVSLFAALSVSALLAACQSTTGSVTDTDVDASSSAAMMEASSAMMMDGSSSMMMDGSSSMMMDDSSSSADAMDAEASSSDAM